MKLIVLIPCLNEELYLEKTIRDIPQQIAGVSSLEIIVIDDGSTDQTSKVAREAGVKNIIRFAQNRGLAETFRQSLDRAIACEADIIVNFDADNQYPGSEIPNLIAPIIRAEADIVIGNRSPELDSRNSLFKKIMYFIGRKVTSWLISQECPDPVSGFRAFSREAALELNIFSTFSHTLETIIQASEKRLKITYIPVRANDKLRPSRLFTSIPGFLFFSARTIVDTYLLYKPLKTFFILGSVFVLIGLVPILRFILIYYLENGAAGHIQSLVIGGVLLLVGVVFYLAGILSHLNARNRKLLEQLLKNSKVTGRHI